MAVWTYKDDDGEDYEFDERPARRDALVIGLRFLRNVSYEVYRVLDAATDAAKCAANRETHAADFADEARVSIEGITTTSEV